MGAGRWGLRTHLFMLDVAEVTWPSSLWLITTAGAEDTLGGWIIVAASVGANGALYPLVGTVLSMLRRKASGDSLLPRVDHPVVRPLGTRWTKNRRAVE